MNPPRPVAEREKLVITKLLENKPDTAALIRSLDNTVVCEMEDGGMGSLVLLPQGAKAIGRLFGREIALAEYIDSDGGTVSLSLNVDGDGLLFELDSWKVDFTPLLKWPDPVELTVVG